MASLVEFLYPLPDYRRQPLTLLRWWESRRPIYNLCVGGAGLVTLASLWVITFGDFDPLHPATVMGVVAYGVGANLCYSLGWGFEMVARWMWGSQAPDLGPLLFRQGLIFSVGLTLLPVLGVILLRTLWLVALIVQSIIG